MYAFLMKGKEFLEKYNEILVKVRNIIEKDLIVNLYITKNI